VRLRPVEQAKSAGDQEISAVNNAVNANVNTNENHNSNNNNSLNNEDVDNDFSLGEEQRGSPECDEEA